MLAMPMLFLKWIGKVIDREISITNECTWSEFMSWHPLCPFILPSGPDTLIHEQEN